MELSMSFSLHNSVSGLNNVKARARVEVLIYCRCHETTHCTHCAHHNTSRCEQRVTGCFAPLSVRPWAF